jgi:hypothetical protein
LVVLLAGGFWAGAGVVWANVRGMVAAANAIASKVDFIFPFSLRAFRPLTTPFCARTVPYTIACVG